MAKVETSYFLRAVVGGLRSAGNKSVDWSYLCCCAMQRYDEAAEAYEEGLKTSPGDAALGRGLDDVLKAQAASKAPAGECDIPLKKFSLVVCSSPWVTALC